MDECHVINVNELEQNNSIKIYPNPININSNIIFNNIQSKEYKLNIYDIYGKLLNELSTNQNIFDIGFVNQYKKGIYIIQLSDSNGLIFTSKIINN